MAKASQLARLAKREKLVKKYAVKRAALKLAGDSEGLQKLPRNSSRNMQSNAQLSKLRVTLRDSKSFRRTPHQYA